MPTPIAMLRFGGLRPRSGDIEYYSTRAKADLGPLRAVALPAARPAIYGAKVIGILIVADGVSKPASFTAT
jgi:hypothetical protein